MVAVLDNDAVELHGGSTHAKLERREGVLAMDADLVVIDSSFDLLGPEVFPRSTPLRGDGECSTKYQERDRNDRSSLPDGQSASHVMTPFW
jgi:hypothetical protein